MNEALSLAFGIGEADSDNPVERLAQELLDNADGNPSIALRIAAGTILMAEERSRRRRALVSRGYVRRALEDLDG